MLHISSGKRVKAEVKTDPNNEFSTSGGAARRHFVEPMDRSANGKEVRNRILGIVDGYTGRQ